MLLCISTGGEKEEEKEEEEKEEEGREDIQLHVHILTITELHTAANTVQYTVALYTLTLNLLLEIQTLPNFSLNPNNYQ